MNMLRNRQDVEDLKSLLTELESAPVAGVPVTEISKDSGMSADRIMTLAADNKDYIVDLREGRLGLNRFGDCKGSVSRMHTDIERRFRLAHQLRQWAIAGLGFSALVTVVFLLTR